MEAPDIIKVATTSRPSLVAGSIASTYREHGYAIVQAVGAGAVNQAIKAFIVARSYLLEEGVDVALVAVFADVTINSLIRTALRFRVEKRDALATTSDAMSPVFPNPRVYEPHL